MKHTSKIPRLQLVGCLYKGSSSDVGSFLYQSWEMLMKVSAGNLTRQMQYASGDGDNYIQFAGIEISEIRDIPRGMIVWDINNDIWTVSEERDGQIVVIGQSKVDWKWLDTSNLERPIGEFTAVYPAEWSNKGTAECQEFRIVSHSWIGAPGNDDIYLVDYDPSWPEKYEQMKQQILELLGSDIALRIEHYGSTSIPGIPAKPIVDILVEIPSWEEGRKRAIPAFSSPENEYWYYNDHLCFILRDKTTGIRTHHIHMAPAGHRLWEGLAFRDYLRTHSGDAARYVALKYELAQRYQDDREGYTNAKETFVREITDKALQGNS